MRFLPLLLAPLALVACDVRTDAHGDNVHIGFGGDADGNANGDAAPVSIKLPGFSAKVNLAGLDLGAHSDFDGVRLAPDTAIRTMDVDSKGGSDDGNVHLAFANPSAPARLMDYYHGELDKAGFTIVSSSGDAIKATKAGKSFALALTPVGTSSHGTITISGN